MGANAQTSVPAFTAGQVLTAQQQTEINTGIPVFATTTTRDAAFGGTGEKTLAEGQMAYIEDIAGSSAVQYYDGSAWQTLVAGGLTLIKTQTIGTTVSSVTVSDAFSATYDNYLITINGGASSAAGANLYLTLGATATGYYFGANYCTYAGATGAFSGANITRIEETCLMSPQGINMQMVIKNPFLATRTLFNWQVSGAATTAVNLNVNGGGYLDNTTSYTAFTLTANTGTVTGGTIRVYGYQNS